MQIFGVYRKVKGEDGKMVLDKKFHPAFFKHQKAAQRIADQLNMGNMGNWDIEFFDVFPVDVNELL